ncbi:histidinol-phosphatase [Limisphaera sp. VF-2]|jgi:histidinol-phosphatase (PHP family)|uniref:histidinol-phosphatase n=1 Tax=Limisphaera sp. VF-2 TaxID=3400418 RepID=UPI001755AB4B|nr:histidinol-phosphatase [Limisphaera sp.]
MDWPPDYHMHTPLCRHATGTPVAYARQARARGLREIGFADHAPMPRDDFDDWRMRQADLDVYLRDVEAARQAVPEVVIRIGLEVDYLPGMEEWIRDLMRRHPWDYLIGSVHYVTDDWAVDNPHQQARWNTAEPVQVWQAYLERLIAAAGSGLFDVLGHVDLPKKFGHAPPPECAPLWDTLFTTARRTGCAIEINTAGLRKACREMYPSLPILRAACRAGVPIVFGSDAHAPEEVAADWSAALALARAAGYRQYVRLAGRRAEPRDLPADSAEPAGFQGA